MDLDSQHETRTRIVLLKETLKLIKKKVTYLMKPTPPSKFQSPFASTGCAWSAYILLENKEPM